MEDFYIIRKTISEAIKKGYKSNHHKNLDDSFLVDVLNDKWVMSDGHIIGSTWEVILSPEFAKHAWGDNYQKVLTDLVIKDETDRILYLRNLLPAEMEDNDEEEKESETKEIELSSNSVLMQMIMKSNEHLKETSSNIFRMVCEEQFRNLKPIISKNSITELEYSDFIKLNWYNRMSNGALLFYLEENSKKSFSICPECGSQGFNHSEDCSMLSKSEFLHEQDEYIEDDDEEGC